MKYRVNRKQAVETHVQPTVGAVQAHVGEGGIRVDNTSVNGCIIQQYEIPPPQKKIIIIKSPPLTLKNPIYRLPVCGTV